MRQVRVLALRDDAQFLGLRMMCGAALLVDILDEQAAAAQAAVDCGDVAIEGFSPTEVAPVVAEEAPAPRKRRG